MQIIEAKPLETSLKVALIVSRFNEEICDKLLEGAINRLSECVVPEENITVVRVPGAIEISLVAQRLANMKYYDAIIALGAVIRGETSHYDYVCKQVSDGCQKVSLKYNLPVIFGILTTDNEEQALARLGGEFGHKGREAVDAAMQMISILRQI